MSDPALPPAFSSLPAIFSKQKLQAAFAQLPLSFIPNRGQVDKRVKFYGRSGSAGFFFARDEVVYAFVRREEAAAPGKVSRSAMEGTDRVGRRVGCAHRSGCKEKEEGVDQDHTSTGGHTLGHVIRLRFIGANPDPVIEGQEELPGKVNYFTGNDPARWKKNLSIYGQVRYREKELPVVGACVIINATVYGRGGASGLRGNTICRYMGRHWRQSISCDKLLP